jgi:hypothetical protein
MSDEAKEKSIIHNWLFHFNQYADVWNGFPRKEFREYFNGTCNKVIADKDIEEVFSKIIEDADV